MADLSAQLSALFQQHAEKQTQEAQAREQEGRAQVQFVADFLRLRDTIIFPAMAEAIELIKQQGWTGLVTSYDGNTDANGNGGYIGIAMIIFLGTVNPTYRSRDYPRLTCIANPDSQKVLISYSASSPSYQGGSGAAYPADNRDITSTYIQEQIGALVKGVIESLSNPRPYRS